ARTRIRGREYDQRRTQGASVGDAGRAHGGGNSPARPGAESLGERHRPGARLAQYRERGSGSDRGFHSAIGQGVVMKNFVAPGKRVRVGAPAGGVTSGAVVIVGAIVGVASTTQSAGAEVELGVEGIYDLSKVAADALAAGAVAKIVTASGLVGAAGTAAIGWV